jgi:broad specificity phosphatase PhoE
MAPKKVTIVRHGHRQDFVGDEWAPDWGQTAARPDDPDISERGIREAKALAQHLKGRPINHIFSSPFLRTVHTASYSAKALGLPINLEDGLHEWMHPSFFPAFPELRTRDELEALYGGINPDYSPRGERIYPEETLDAVGRRTSETLNRLVNDFDGDLLLFTHADPLVAILRTAGIDWFTTPIRTCAIYEITQTKTHWTLTENATCHHLT